MNLKLELFKAFLSAVIGAFIYAQFSDNKPKPVVSQAQQSECKVIVKKVTKPDGSIDEVTEFLSNNSQKQVVAQKPAKAQYSLGLSGLKSVEYISPSARLGDLPLWVGVDVSLKDLKDSKLQLRMEF